MQQTRRASDNFEACPRYDKHELSEEQITEIAKRAVILAKTEFYVDVGKSVTSKALIVLGILTLAAAQWLTLKGYLK